MRIAAPQPVGGAGGTLLRGPLTAPGDHRVRTDEFDVTVHVNRAGFVDREWSGQVGGEIIVVGDSFVQAAQVAPGESFGARLEAELRAGGRDVDVLSMGVPGAGTGTALGLLRTYALPRRPAVVVLGFLVANDVLNNHPLLEGKDDKPFYALRGGRLEPIDADSTVADSPLWRWSAAWRFVRRAGVMRQVVERKLALGAGVPLDLRVHDPACVRGGGTAAHCATWDEAWAITDALLGEIAAACGDVPFLVALFPDAVQVLQAAPEWPAAAGWDLDAAQQRAASVASPHATVVDLLPTLRAAEGALYLPRDGHWTALGHAAAAGAVAPAVAGALTTP